MKVISFWVIRKVPSVSINVGKQTSKCLFQLALHWSSMEGNVVFDLWCWIVNCLIASTSIASQLWYACWELGWWRKLTLTIMTKPKIWNDHLKKKDSDRDRTRTCNLQIRSLAPYPLGHTVSYWPLTLPVKPTSALYQTMLQCSSLQRKDDLWYVVKGEHN